MAIAISQNEEITTDPNDRETMTVSIDTGSRIHLEFTEGHQ